MEKNRIKTMSKYDTPNVNNVVYSKDVLMTALDKYFEKNDTIPVTIGSSIYTSDGIDVSEFLTVKSDEIIGSISMEDIGEEFVDIKVQESKNIQCLNELINNGFGLGLRYMADCNTDNDVTVASNMKIISYDIIPPNSTEE